MAHTLSGAHNIRKNETRRLRNKAAKSALRTQIRNARKEQKEGKPPRAYRELFRVLKSIGT